MRRPRLAVIAALFAAACGEPPTGPITALPRQLTPAEGQLVDVGNGFTFRVIREAVRLEQPGANVFVSPLSVSMALGMAYNGASGSTETVMEQTLGLNGMSRDDINTAYRGLIDLLRGLDRNVEFTIANSVWYRSGFAFAPSFFTAMQTWFDAEVQDLDFGSPSAPTTINNWVSQQTAGRIPDIVPSPLPNDAVMYLINAIYFKANWTTRFDPAKTMPLPFYLAGGGQAQVQTMRHTEDIPVRTTYDNGVAVVDLPYGGGAWSMTIAMPLSGNVDSLIGQLTAERWNAWIASLDSTESQLQLPKFTMRYELAADTVLKLLGLAPAYCHASPPPDFSRMTNESVCISRVKHKTFVLVDEAGTEAAAVTSVEVGVTSAPPVIQINRPFVFAIRERFSGTVLFIGRMMNPAAP